MALVLQDKSRNRRKTENSLRGYSMAGCKTCPTNYSGCRGCKVLSVKVERIPYREPKVRDDESHVLWIHFADKGIPSRKYLVLPRDVRGVEKYWEDQGLACYSEYAGPKKVKASEPKLTSQELIAKIMGD